MTRGYYKYTHKKYGDWLDNQIKLFENEHGIPIKSIDAENILVEKILRPNNINLTDVLKPVDINKKWKKLRLKL